MGSVAEANADNESDSKATTQRFQETDALPFALVMERDRQVEGHPDTREADPGATSEPLLPPKGKAPNIVLSR